MRTLSLTGVFIEDTLHGGVTAYFREWPAVIAEGDTEEEAEANLWEALAELSDFQREEARADATESSLRREKKYTLSA